MDTDANDVAGDGGESIDPAASAPSPRRRGPARDPITNKFISSKPGAGGSQAGASQARRGRPKASALGSGDEAAGIRLEGGVKTPRASSKANPIPAAALAPLVQLISLLVASWRGPHWHLTEPETAALSSAAANAARHLPVPAGELGVYGDVGGLLAVLLMIVAPRVQQDITTAAAARQQQRPGPRPMTAPGRPAPGQPVPPSAYDGQAVGLEIGANA